MAKHYNKVVLVGNLGADPKITDATAEKKAFGNYSLYIDDDIYRVVVFDKQAELVKDILKKGTLVLVEGRLKTSKYTPEGKTEPVYSINIIGDRFVALSNKSADDNMANEIPKTPNGDEPF